MRNYNERPNIPLILDIFFLLWNHGAESLLLSGGPLFPPGIALRLGGAFLRRITCLDLDSACVVTYHNLDFTRPRFPRIPFFSSFFPDFSRNAGSPERRTGATALTVSRRPVVTRCAAYGLSELT
jgi:hypothetical protein